MQNNNLDPRMFRCIVLGLITLILGIPLMTGSLYGFLIPICGVCIARICVVLYGLATMVLGLITMYKIFKISFPKRR